MRPNRPGEPVRLVRTGIANVEAVAAAFGRLGRPCVVVERPDDILVDAPVVLPGVGSFESGARSLAASGCGEAIRQRVGRDLPTLAVCLGLQLLLEGSEEAPGTAGLGCIPGTASRFPDTVRVPQLGWNDVRPAGEGGLVRSGLAYFANSYRLVEVPRDWRAATTPFGGDFVAALERGRILACQFHPELSGPWGAGLIARWLEAWC